MDVLNDAYSDRWPSGRGLGSGASLFSQNPPRFSPDLWRLTCACEPAEPPARLSVIEPRKSSNVPQSIAQLVLQRGTRANEINGRLKIGKPLLIQLNGATGLVLGQPGKMWAS